MFGMIDDDSTNALELLKRDHDAVDRLFEEYDEIKDGAEDCEKEQLVGRICHALTVHARIEETIFYPAARRVLQEQESKDLLDEAAVEHQTLKDIIGRLEAAPTDDPLFDAGVKVLSEYVKHHVREEENELFPKVRASDMDLQAIGLQLVQRKEQLERRGSQGAGNESRERKSSRAAGESRTSRNAH
ncbi:MAG: hemerythrin domain-containing protein [Burkholderiales bacterium]